jgi:hypothetical protein
MPILSSNGARHGPKSRLAFNGCYGGLKDHASITNISMPKTRIMYVENKSASLNGSARIGRVTFSKTGKSISYGGRTFQSLKGSGFKANYFDVETGEKFWISGPRKDGKDRLYAESSAPIQIDPDVAEEYWRDIRGKLSE